jgi:hypothetical protein
MTFFVETQGKVMLEKGRNEGDKGTKGIKKGKEGERDEDTK